MGKYNQNAFEIFILRPFIQGNYPSGNKRKQKLKKEKKRGEVVWEDQTRRIDSDNPDLPHFAPLAHC